MRTLVVLLIAAVLIAIALTLGAENGLYVRFNYLLAQGEYRLSTLMVVWFVIGFVAAVLMCATWLVRGRLQIRRLRRQIAAQSRLLQAAESSQTPANQAITHQTAGATGGATH